MEILLFFLAGIILTAIGAFFMLRSNKQSAAAAQQQALADAAAQSAHDLQFLKERMLAEQDAATARLQADLDNANNNLTQVRQDAENERKRLTEDANARIAEAKQTAEKANADALNAQKMLFDEQLAKMKEEIKNSTNEAFRASQEALKKANSESVGNLLDPIQKEMENVRKLMGETQNANTQSTSKLTGVLEQMMSQTNKISQEANNLADALKNRGKVHGDWGEQVLADILLGSGLIEGTEFSCQESFKGENGNELRPDVVVNCPDGTRIIIDSKVSLTAYSNALGAENEVQRQEAVKDNFRSVRQHVDELVRKQYHKYVEKALNYVLMFIPNEGAYVMAMNHDPSLAQEAFNKGVIIVNPTNLMLCLKLILQTWQQTRQEDNCRKIIEAANGMYDKVMGLVDTCETLGGQLETASRTYNNLHNQLRDGKGNLLGRVENLKGLGVTSTKRPKKSSRSLSATDWDALPEAPQSSEDGQEQTPSQYCHTAKMS